MGYDLYSEFDINQHKKTYINYLEVLIEPNGHVLYAVPSHQELAIRLACEKRGWSRKRLCNECPEEFYSDFLSWVLGLTGCISVWNTLYVGKPNEVQKSVLRELRASGLYAGNI